MHVTLSDVSSITDVQLNVVISGTGSRRPLDEKKWILHIALIPVYKQSIALERGLKSICYKADSMPE